jgi:hypothetical protein
VTTHNSLEAEPGAAKNTESLDALVRILRTGRTKAAGTAREDMSERAVIKRECPLIETDEDENECLHKIKSESHPPSPKASAGQGKSIKSKVGGGIPTIDD